MATLFILLQNYLVLLLFLSSPSLKLNAIELLPFKIEQKHSEQISEKDPKREQLSKTYSNFQVSI